MAMPTRRFYLSTPIYYVNAEPHLGHAYTTIAGDVLARHMRQRGEDVFYLTGTDEHGEPIAQAAERLGLTPQELVDRNAPKFEDLTRRVNATNDFFVRTSDPDHKRAVLLVATPGGIARKHKADHRADAVAQAIGPGIDLAAACDLAAELRTFRQQLEAQLRAVPVDLGDRDTTGEDKTP